MFTIVTHHAPDLDALVSVWLIKRFLPNWQDATVAFVPAGKTLKNEPADFNPHILHVDTGFGFLDHHQSDADTCAAKKTYEYLQKKISPDHEFHDEAIARIVEVVNFYDHFQEVGISDIIADYHLFDAISIIDGLKNIYADDDQKIVDVGFVIVDAIYRMFKERIWAEEIMDAEGIPFMTKWGKGLAFETLNDAVLKLAQKKGYFIVVRKDPKKGYIRIKAHPKSQVDLSGAYEIFKKTDPEASWYLHSSRKLLLNGSTRNPDMKPTKLTLREIMEVLIK